jgi:hypothetical protein
MQDNRFKLIFASIPKGVHISCSFFKNDSLFNKHSVIAYKKKKKKSKIEVHLICQQKDCLSRL